MRTPLLKRRVPRDHDAHMMLLSPLLRLLLVDELTREMTVDIGGRARQLTLLAPADSLSRFPAGALWPSGTALASALAGGGEGSERLGGLCAGARVLELGCGLGAAGVAAAAAGASSVTFSDGDRAACALAARSCALDGARRGGDGGVAAVDALRIDWADEATWPPAGQFDLVLGADLSKL